MSRTKTCSEAALPLRTSHDPASRQHAIEEELLQSIPQNLSENLECKPETLKAYRLVCKSHCCPTQDGFGQVPEHLGAGGALEHGRSERCLLRIPRLGSTGSLQYLGQPCLLYGFATYGLQF